MSNFVPVLLAVLLLTLLGCGALIFITYKYYWGERGKPPVTGEEKKLRREEELRIRAEQVEYFKANPPKPRKPGFWDNTRSG